MDIVLDTSTIINLINGAVLDKILLIDTHRFFIGSHLLSKEILDDVQKIIVEAFVKKGLIALIHTAAPVSEISALQLKYRLGLGETECIFICMTTHLGICTDDLKARKFSTTEFGQQRVHGSLSLLKEGVASGAIKCLEAVDSYKMMTAKGAFLPKGLTSDYFCC